VKTVPDVIEELRHAAEIAQHALLLVSFEDETKYVFSNDVNLPQTLASMVQSGGEPVAIAQWLPKEYPDREIKVSVLPKYKDEFWISGYIVSKWDVLREQFTKATDQQSAPSSPSFKTAGC
jgi:hypothetical protein